MKRSDRIGEPGHLLVRQWLLAVFVILVFTTSAHEIVTEFGVGGESLVDMWDDVLWLIISAGCVLYYLYERKMRTREIENLRGRLNSARGKLAAIDDHSKEIANQYRSVMQKQFEAWKLSASEQDVVICMLKGLTFREIAGLRDTREKTVRQQASAVYRKAGVSSRSELTAWFFEDMLDPPRLDTTT